MAAGQGTVGCHNFPMLLTAFFPAPSSWFQSRSHFSSTGHWWGPGSCPLLRSQHCSFLLQAGHLGHPYSTSFLTDVYSRATLFLSQKSTCFILLGGEGWQKSAIKAQDKNLEELFSPGPWPGECPQSRMEARGTLCFVAELCGTCC